MNRFETEYEGSFNADSSGVALTRCKLRNPEAALSA